MRKSKYLEKYEVYAARYDVSLRTVKRWGKDGAPLDVPEKMVSWREKTMTNRTPDSIVVAAARETTLPVNEPPRETVPVEDEEMGIAATQKRLRNAEVLMHRAYVRAVESEDDGKIRAALRNWNDISDQVRTMVEVARKDEMVRRELIPRVEAEAVLVELHGSIFSTLRGLFPAVARLYGVENTPENEAKWEGICNGFCDGLKKEVFDAGE